VDDQQQSRWQPTRQHLLWAGAAVGLLTVAILIGYRYGITLWDWIKLLIVPAVIAGGGLWFNRQQRERELEIAREQRERDVEIAERRTQDEALQAYLDQMSDMLTPNKDRPSLYRARPGDSLSSVARARTLTVLSRLDGHRKARVVQFLYEAGLIAKDRPVLTLRGANLSEADQYQANLSEADLSGTILSLASLFEADLSSADLTGAILRMVNLREAKLCGAHLIDADLIGADLIGADLGGADLGAANLTGAKGITNKELEQQAASLEDATMPNGQKYEDWLKDQETRGKQLTDRQKTYLDWVKDKEGRGEDGENSGPS
jgi:uncharacterized protein YjbI with pentapeptide repeats